MVGKVTIRVAGTQELEAAFKELGAAAANRIARSALNRSATPIVKRAKELVPQPGPGHPYATGELRDSITKRLLRHRAGSDRQTILIGVERPRSRITHLVEFGTAHQAAQPFLRPALDESVYATLKIQREAMAEGIDREVRRLAGRAVAKAGFRS